MQHPVLSSMAPLVSRYAKRTLRNVRKPVAYLVEPLGEGKRVRKKKKKEGGGDRRQGDGTRQAKREGGGPDHTAAAALSVLLLAAKRPFAWLPADLDPIVSNYAVGPLSSENE